MGKSKDFNECHENAKDLDKLLRKYESKIILFGDAERMLQRKDTQRPSATSRTKKIACLELNHFFLKKYIDRLYASTHNKHKKPRGVLEDE